MIANGLKTHRNHQLTEIQSYMDFLYILGIWNSILGKIAYTKMDALKSSQLA